MAVENRIVKVQKRNRALVRFDESRIHRAILRAAQSIGGFRQDFLPGINDRIFEAHGNDERIAEFLAESAIVCLNSDPHHLIANFPPRIETIQDEVVHALRSYGFQCTADAYSCYRWGRHWLREGAIGTEHFVGNGFEPSTPEAPAISLPELNEAMRSRRFQPLISSSIAAYEAALDQAAEKVIARLNAGDPLRMIWVSGPSSSGKTTTTVKLTRRLQSQGLRFLMLNLDDYFWSLVEHPTDWINDRNYETPEAMDIQLLNRQLIELLDGKTVEKPTYSFKEGRRTASKPIRLERGQILLLDCLHGLYPPITENIPAECQFRLYIENHNSLPLQPGEPAALTLSTDVRLLRRMLRDARHRNHSPLLTLLHWHYVRAGELFSIIPLRGLADARINGGFPFDLPALKPFFSGPATGLPAAAGLNEFPGFLDSRIRHLRLCSLLSAVEGFSVAELASHDCLPGDALIREFIGGSTIQIPHNE